MFHALVQRFIGSLNDTSRFALCRGAGACSASRASKCSTCPLQDEGFEQRFVMLCHALSMGMIKILCQNWVFCFQTKPHDFDMTCIHISFQWCSKIFQHVPTIIAYGNCAPFASTVELSCIAGSCFQLAFFVHLWDQRSQFLGILVCLNYGAAPFHRVSVWYLQLKRHHRHGPWQQHGPWPKVQ